jgi:hypothetical protein
VSAAVHGPCIPWTGRINVDGYGTIGCRLAHRVAWIDVHGVIPDGLELDHLCHDPEVCQLGSACPHRRCCNVEHLEVVTHTENIRRSGAANHQRAKTHCPAGHAYADHGVTVDGRRHCRPCGRDAVRRYQRAKRRAAAARRCAGRGHVREERIGPKGARSCAICRKHAGQANARARWAGVTHAVPAETR